MEMKTHRKKVLFTMTAAAFMLILSASAYAEGSRDMVKIDSSLVSDDTLAQSPAYRPYLDWRDRSQFGMPSKNVIYVHANAGETVYFGSSTANASDRSIEAVVQKDSGFTSTLNFNGLSFQGASIAVTLPAANGSDTAYDPEGRGNIFVDGSYLSSGCDNTKVYLFKTDKTTMQGYIADPAMEANGPNINGTTNGYTPLSFIAPYTGTYSFRFLSPEYGKTDVEFVQEEYQTDTYQFMDFNNAPICSYKNANGDVNYNEDVVGNVNLHYSYIQEKPGENPKNRGIQVSQLGTDITIGHWTFRAGKKYFSNLGSASTTGGYMQFTTKYNGTFLEVYWGFDQSPGSNKSVTLNYEINGKKSVAESETVPGKYVATIGPLSAQQQVKLFITNASASIYSIIYRYNSNASTIPETETLTGLARKVNEPWANSKSEVAAWDVTVVGTDGQEKKGRAWADILFLNAGGYQKSIYPVFHVLTKDGFLYDVNMNGIQPYSYIFYSNNRGYLYDPYGWMTEGNRPEYLQPLEHSFFSRSVKEDGKYGSDVGDPPVRHSETDGSSWNSYILPNYVPTDPYVDYTHKIFFNPPSLDAILTTTDNSSLKGDVGNPLPIEQQLIKNVTYTGEGKSADNSGEVHYGTKGVGGMFDIELSRVLHEGKWWTTALLYDIDEVSVKLDFSRYLLDENSDPVLDENGRWKEVTDDSQITEAMKNNIMTITVNFSGDVPIAAETEPEGSHCEMYWEGIDAYGNIVPPGVYDKNIYICSMLGAAHFPVLDAEHNPNGIKIQIANTANLPGGDPFDANRDTVYYNNEANSPFDGNTNGSSWFFTGYKSGEEGKYPSRIGDGMNYSGGISSNYGNSSAAGAMVFGEYDDTVDSGAREACADDNNTATGYGNYTALDIWIKYDIDFSNKVAVGVNDLTDGTCKPYVSFVATESDKGIAAAPLNSSHVGAWEWDRGFLSQKRYETENYGTKRYASTISTGFIVTVPADTVQNGSNINWTITIPADGTYIKDGGYSKTSGADGERIDFLNMLLSSMETSVQSDDTPDEAIESIGDIADMGDEAGSSEADELIDMTDNAIPDENEDTGWIFDEIATLSDLRNSDTLDAILDDPVITDEEAQFNKGAIYPVNSFRKYTNNWDQVDSVTLKLRYNLPQLNITNANIQVGLVLDNIYAPNSYIQMDGGVTTGTADSNADQYIHGRDGTVISTSYDEYTNSEANPYNSYNRQ